MGRFAPRKAVFPNRLFLTDLFLVTFWHLTCISECFECFCETNLISCFMGPIDSKIWKFEFKIKHNFCHSMFLFPLLQTIVFWKFLLTFQIFQFWIISFRFIYRFIAFVSSICDVHTFANIYQLKTIYGILFLGCTPMLMSAKKI